MMAIAALDQASPTLTRDGAERLVGAIDATALAAIELALTGQPRDRSGVRLSGIAELARFLSSDKLVGRLAVDAIGFDVQPVRAILFDKSPAANWALGWHQDRTIAVRVRHDVPGYGPWSIKAGMQHVEPPFALLERMVTLRLHLDAVDAGNAPLLVAPGSHRMGRVPERGIAGVVERCGTPVCLAEPGDVWIYSTPILHASAAAARPSRRRVLQVDYSAGKLPGDLVWLGV